MVNVPRAKRLRSSYGCIFQRVWRTLRRSGKIPEDDLLLVRSKWEWSESSKWVSVRQTWDPEKQDFGDDKASGLDTVFSSRLPKPFRIGTLDDPEDEHKKLLTLVLQPVADRLKAKLADSASDLNQALAAFVELAEVPVKEERNKLDTIKEDLNVAHSEVFPGLEIDFDIGLGDIKIDPMAQLVELADKVHQVDVKGVLVPTRNWFTARSVLDHA